MQNQQNNWYRSIIDKVNEFAESFGLNDLQTNRFRDFVMAIARDQFKAGNRSGAGWAFEQARKKIAEGQAV